MIVSNFSIDERERMLMERALRYYIANEKAQIRKCETFGRQKDIIISEERIDAATDLLARFWKIP